MTSISISTTCIMDSPNHCFELNGKKSIDERVKRKNLQNI